MDSKSKKGPKGLKPQTSRVKKTMPLPRLKVTPLNKIDKKYDKRIEEQTTKEIGNVNVETKESNSVLNEFDMEGLDISAFTSPISKARNVICEKHGVKELNTVTIPETVLHPLTTHEPHPHTPLHVEPDNLNKKLPTEVVSMCCPANAITKNLIDKPSTSGSPITIISKGEAQSSSIQKPEVKPKTFLKSGPLSNLTENSTITGQKNNEENLSRDIIESYQKYVIIEFDPLYIRNPGAKYKGVSNKQLLDNVDNEHKKICTTEKECINPFTVMNRTAITIPETPKETETIVICDSPKSPDFFSESDSTPEKLIEAETVPQNEIVNFTSSYDKLDNEVQIIEEIKTLTGRPKSSPILKLEKTSSTLTEQKTKVLTRPTLNDYGPHFNGILTWIADDNLVHNSKSWHCALAEHRLFCYVDPGMHVLREVFKLSSINSLQLVLPVLSSANSSYCFELGMSNSENSGMKQSTAFKITFGCPTAAERSTWAQKIAANLTSAFPSINNAEFTRLGWCYLKVGVSAEWNAAWLVLVQRVLMYHCTNNMAGNADLRKTRLLDTQPADEESIKACLSDCSSNLLLDCSTVTLYLRFPNKEEFQSWSSVINLAARTNGSQIDEQQLTSEEVPTIVDKCIKFIYCYGILSEGIYRRAGSGVVLTELLTRFRTDAWSVQLTPQHYSEHDVAGVLKRFFRDLPIPLIRKECHEELIKALAIPDEATRHVEYQRALNTLEPVTRNTARKLFAHLHSVHQWNDTNKMSAENLASVWAPTIMPADLATNISQMSWSEKEVNIVRDLIVNYEEVWCPNDEEKKRDLACHGVMLKMQESARPTPPPSSAGNLRIWVFIFDNTTNYQVTLTPDKTSADVCMELSVKTKMPYHKLMLEEQICNKTMTRIMHKDEIVLDVVLRWGYWDEDDRIGNCLIIKENKILHEMDNLRKTMTRVCGPLRFANETSKRFKSYMFEVNNSKLMCFSDTQGSTKVNEWDINDIIWYFGFESKRDPQSRWAITFIPKNKTERNKERRWFGCTVAGGVTESELTWATALMFAQHDDILPQPHNFMP